MSEKKKEDHEDPGICFDNLSFEELRKLMGKEGIGSLCREMMGRMVGTGKGESACLRFMRKMTTEQGNAGEERERNGEKNSRHSKESHGRNS